jgi:hypothetical protein
VNVKRSPTIRLGRLTFSRHHVARAAGDDAGNASMRRAGKKKWSRADYNRAVREYNRVNPR